MSGYTSDEMDGFLFDIREELERLFPEAMTERTFTLYPCAQFPLVGYTFQVAQHGFDGEQGPIILPDRAFKRPEIRNPKTSNEEWYKAATRSMYPAKMEFEQ